MGMGLRTHAGVLLPWCGAPRFPLGRLEGAQECLDDLIGIDQLRLFSFQGGQLAFETRPFVLCPHIHGRITVALFILLPQNLGVGEQCLYMLPHRLLDS
jgi:hypothetical protein